MTSISPLRAVRNDEQGFRIVAADRAGQVDTIEVGKAEVQQDDSGSEFRATWMSAAAPVRHHAVG